MSMTRVTVAVMLCALLGLGASAASAADLTLEAYNNTEVVPGVRVNYDNILNYPTAGNPWSNGDKTLTIVAGAITQKSVTATQPNS